MSFQYKVIRKLIIRYFFYINGERGENKTIVDYVPWSNRRRKLIIVILNYYYYYYSVIKEIFSPRLNSELLFSVCIPYIIDSEPWSIDTMEDLLFSYSK